MVRAVAANAAARILRARMPKALAGDTAVQKTGVIGLTTDLLDVEVRAHALLVVPGQVAQQDVMTGLEVHLDVLVLARPDVGRLAEVVALLDGLPALDLQR